MENLTVFRKSLVDFQSNTQGVGNICYFKPSSQQFYWCGFIVRHFFVVYSTNILILHDNLSMPQIGRLKGFQVLCSYNDYMTVCVDRFHVWRSHPWVILRVFDLGTLVKVGIHTSRTGKFIIIFAFPKNCKGFVQFLGFKNLNSMACCN